MRISLLFGIFPTNYYDEIISNSKGGIQYAADALQKSFIEGIGSLTENVEIINVPYIGSYPQRYTKLYSPKGKFMYETGNGHVIQGETLRFCNLKAYKMFSSYQVARKALLKWVKKNKSEQRVIMIYAIYAPFIKAAVDVKKKYPDTKLLLIVPDLPEYMGGKKSTLLDSLRTVQHSFLNKWYSFIDYYVLLSRFMTERLPVDEKQWTVIEGIFNGEKDDIYVEKQSVNQKTVFYSGTLARRYGVMNLVQAFMEINNPSYRLIICGAGDAKDNIIKLAKVDGRIIYKGLLPREEILKLQKQSDVLVNPRTPEGEFTKYSFPSKTMEYLASGTPTLLYRLPGIPDEYFDYCFVIEELGIDALKDKIESVLNIPSAELKHIGDRARQFIIEQKNPMQQCKKIFNLIDNTHVNL